MSTGETYEQTVERIRAESYRISRQNVYTCEVMGAPDGPNAWKVVAVELRAGGWGDFDVLQRIDLSEPYRRGGENTAAAIDALAARDARAAGVTCFLACEDDRRADLHHTRCGHY